MPVGYLNISVVRLAQTVKVRELQDQDLLQVSGSVLSFTYGGAVAFVLSK